MTRVTTNDTVLTDIRTPRAWVDELIRQLVEDGEIFSESKMTTGIHVTPDVLWELSPKELVALVEADNTPTDYTWNPLFIHGIPYEVREDKDPEAIEEFKTLTTNDVAENVAYGSTEYGSVQDETGNHCDGYERVALIVVHEDTTQCGGFIPLVRAYLEDQQDFQMLKLMRVFVHNGTRASIRPFAENPVTIRQMG